MALRNCIRTKLATSAILLLASVRILLTSAQTHAADIALVTHVSNPLQTIDAVDARRIFLKQTTEFPDGNRVQIAALPSASELRREFDQKVLQMSPSQVKTYWARSIFTGQNKPPQEFLSAEAMRQWVAKTPGSLGYLEVNDVDDSVKVLLTVGVETGR